MSFITPLNGVALFSQQDMERQEKEMAKEAKKKSKMDLVLAREHQCMLAAATKVFANPLSSYNHKDDLLDIVVALGLDCTGTMTMLTKCIQSHLASHPQIALQPRFSGLMKACKSRKCMHTDVDVPSQDQGGLSISN